MNRSQLEALLDKLAADDASLQAQAVRKAEASDKLLVTTMMALQALASALEKLLDIVADEHGGIIGPWLNEIEIAVMKNARDSLASGATPESAAMITKGIQAVQEVFMDFRGKRK
jgi:hypothetical protein